jgi:hypothetical protein
LAALARRIAALLLFSLTICTNSIPSSLRNEQD